MTNKRFTGNTWAARRKAIAARKEKTVKKPELVFPVLNFGSVDFILRIKK